MDGVVSRGFVEGDAADSVVGVPEGKTVTVLTPLPNNPLLLFFLKVWLKALLLLAGKLARTVMGVLGVMTAEAAVAGKLRGPG